MTVGALKCDANSWVKVMCVSLLWPASNQLNVQCAQLQSALHSVSRSSWLLFWHAPSICPDHTGLLFCLHPAHRPSSWHFLPCCSSFPRRHLFGPFLLHTHMWTCYLSASQHQPVRPDNMRNVWNCLPGLFAVMPLHFLPCKRHYSGCLFVLFTLLSKLLRCVFVKCTCARDCGQIYFINRIIQTYLMVGYIISRQNKNSDSEKKQKRKNKNQETKARPREEMP